MRFASDIHQSRYESPLGAMVLAATRKGLAGAWFMDQRHAPDWSAWPMAPADSLLRLAAVQLAEYFAGTRARFELPLDLSAGTAFQQSVWHQLLAIGHGCTSSYGSISAAAGRPAAVRATGAAVGRNPLTIIVPCHRVLGANGALTGYAGGLQRKVALLQLESPAPLYA